MLYFDTIPVELLHQILYNIFDFNDVVRLYESDLLTVKKVFDDPMYWEGKVRYYIIPFTIDFNEYEKEHMYDELDFLKKRITLTYGVDYTDKFDININYKNIPSYLVDYKDKGIFHNLLKFKKILSAYNYTIDIIKHGIGGYFEDPDVDFLMPFEYDLNQINDFDLLCLSCSENEKVKIFNSLQDIYTCTYQMYLYKVRIYIGRYFYFQLSTPGYKGDKYEVKLQNVFDLLLHLHCN